MIVNLLRKFELLKLFNFLENSYFSESDTWTNLCLFGRNEPRLLCLVTRAVFKGWLRPPPNPDALMSTSGGELQFSGQLGDFMPAGDLLGNLRPDGSTEAASATGILDRAAWSGASTQRCL